MDMLDLDGIIGVLLDIMDEHGFNDDDSYSDLNGFVQGYFDGSNGTQFYIEKMENSAYGPAAVLGIEENRYPASRSESHVYDEDHGWDEYELRSTVQHILEEYGY